ncbi:hypothetical protein [Nostoc sphaeroides]|uniref:Uncharacterized protein n=1 Tax=Nostoc sphaeroides CCNUC1 TaxID=2653204 RepID=A0A5P8VT82_9NOSO|nr:hypothetical protein [Nostoc sphaeroides]QFS43534.1 hypothetical protein GXM_01007 [Nostoc sphaeroides CCNUC1]
MTEEEIKEQEKIDKDHAQNKIVLTIMLFIFFSFGLSLIFQLFPKYLPQGILTTSIAGVISLASVDKIVKLVMNDAFQKTELFLKNKYDTHEVVDNQIKDFFSLVQQERSYYLVLNDLDLFVKKKAVLIGSLDEKGQEERGRSFEKSSTCVNELLYSWEEKGKKRNLIKSIVVSALEPFVDKNEPNYKDSCNHLYAYLRAWLVCSIRYQNPNLPIEWIERSSWNKQQQIQVIKYIRDDILERDILVKPQDKDKEPPLCDDSIKEVRKYLNILIEKIEQSI